MSNKIPIFLASDDNYSPFIATTMTSILTHTNSFIEFYILDGGISSPNKVKIKSITANFNNFSVEFIDMAKYGLERFPNIKHYSLNTFSRYFIPDLKPELNKILYLDVDIILKTDISELYETDLGEHPIAGVLEDFCSTNFSYLNMNFEEYKGGQNYFNAGVLVINTQYFRENNLTEDLIKKTIEYKDKLNCPDQDIFNLRFQNDFKILDYKFNIMPDHEKDILELGKSSAAQAISNPTIIHYTGRKPWNNLCAKRAEDFWEIAAITPFYNELKNNALKIEKNEILKLKMKIMKYKLMSLIPFYKKKQKYVDKYKNAKTDLTTKLKLLTKI